MAFFTRRTLLRAAALTLATAGLVGMAQGQTIDEIKKRGVLRVGVAISPPHTVELEDGTFGGPNIIPLENLAKALGVKVATFDEVIENADGAVDTTVPAT